MDIEQQGMPISVGVLDKEPAASKEGSLAALARRMLNILDADAFPPTKEITVGNIVDWSKAMVAARDREDAASYTAYCEHWRANLPYPEQTESLFPPPNPPSSLEDQVWKRVFAHREQVDTLLPQIFPDTFPPGQPIDPEVLPEALAAKAEEILNKFPFREFTGETRDYFLKLGKRLGVAETDVDIAGNFLAELQSLWLSAEKGREVLEEKVYNPMQNKLAKVVMDRENQELLLKLLQEMDPDISAVDEIDDMWRSKRIYWSDSGTQDLVLSTLTERNINQEKLQAWKSHQSDVLKQKSSHDHEVVLEVGHAVKRGVAIAGEISDIVFPGMIRMTFGSFREIGRILKANSKDINVIKLFKLATQDEQKRIFGTTFTKLKTAVLAWTMEELENMGKRLMTPVTEAAKLAVYTASHIDEMQAPGWAMPTVLAEKISRWERGNIAAQIHLEYNNIQKNMQQDQGNWFPGSVSGPFAIRREPSQVSAPQDHSGLIFSEPPALSEPTATIASPLPEETQKELQIKENTLPVTEVAPNTLPLTVPEPVPHTDEDFLQRMAIPDQDRELSLALLHTVRLINPGLEGLTPPYYTIDFSGYLQEHESDLTQIIGEMPRDLRKALVDQFNHAIPEEDNGAFGGIYDNHGFVSREYHWLEVLKPYGLLLQSKRIEDPMELFLGPKPGDRRYIDYSILNKRAYEAAIRNIPDPRIREWFELLGVRQVVVAIHSARRLLENIREVENVGQITLNDMRGIGLMIGPHDEPIPEIKWVEALGKRLQQLELQTAIVLLAENKETLDVTHAVETKIQINNLADTAARKVEGYDQMPVEDQSRIRSSFRDRLHQIFSVTNPTGYIEDESNAMKAARRMQSRDWSKRPKTVVQPSSVNTVTQATVAAEVIEPLVAELEITSSPVQEKPLAPELPQPNVVFVAKAGEPKKPTDAPEKVPDSVMVGNSQEFVAKPNEPLRHTINSPVAALASSDQSLGDKIVKRTSTENKLKPEELKAFKNTMHNYRENLLSNINYVINAGQIQDLIVISNLNLNLLDAETRRSMLDLIYGSTLNMGVSMTFSFIQNLNSHPELVGVFQRLLEWVNTPNLPDETTGQLKNIRNMISNCFVILRNKYSDRAEYRQMVSLFKEVGIYVNKMR